MISFLVGSVPAFLGVPALVGFIGFWFVLGCFRVAWWLLGGGNNE